MHTSTLESSLTRIQTQAQPVTHSSTVHTVLSHRDRLKFRFNCTGFQGEESANFGGKVKQNKKETKNRASLATTKFVHLNTDQL